MGRPLWSAELSWNLPNGDKLAELRLYLENLDGYVGSAQIWNFATPYPFGLNLQATGAEPVRTLWSYLGATSGWTYAGFPSHWVLDATIPLASSQPAGSQSVPLSGLDPGKIVVVPGQYVQVGRRLYTATTLQVADGSGNATLSVTPGLLAAATAGDPVRLVEAACEMRLANPDWDERAQAGTGMVSVSASFIETVTDVS